MMASAVSGTRTTGFFLVPFLPAAVLPSLRVSVTNPGRSGAKASVKVNLLENGSKRELRSTVLDVPAGSTTGIEVPLGQVEGTLAEVVFSPERPGLEPSVTMVKTYTADKSADLALFIPPSSFADARGDGSRTAILSSGPFFVPNIFQIPELRIHLDSQSARRRSARVVVRQAGATGAWAPILDRTLEVPGGGGATVTLDLSSHRGKTLELLVSAPRNVLPSTELVITFQADAANESYFWLSPEQLVPTDPESMRTDGPGAALSFISRKTADVTGDRRPDTVTLRGDRTSEGGYYEDMRLNVRSGRTNRSVAWTPAGGAANGYNPVLWTVPLKDRRTADVMVVTDTGGSGGYVAYSAYTVRDMKPELFLDPETLSGVTVNGYFMDGYRAKVTIAEIGQEFELDLSDRKEYYEQEGTYRDGKLVEPVEVWYTPFVALKPVRLRTGRYGLRGIQAVKGINNSDNLARITSTWNWSDDEWNLLRVKLEPMPFR